MENRHVKRDPKRGITLAEVIVATALVALVLVGTMNGVGSSLKMWVLAERQGHAYGLAEQLMSEIMQQGYKEAGTSVIGVDILESLTSRVDWDDVDDYDGWSSAPEKKDGSPIAGYSEWRRSADVDFVERDNPNTVLISDEGLKRITVTVTDPDGQTTQLVAWRSDWGLMETQPESDTTARSWVGSELVVDGGSPLQGGTALVNKPE